MGIGGSWGCSRCQGAVRGHQGVVGDVRGALGLAGSVGTQGQKGYKQHKGTLVAPGGCRGHQGPSG